MSGVYIHGTEVPKTCGGCISVGWNYVFECRIDDVEEDERLSSCPLISVPDHGDLIERDGLKELLEIRCIEDNWVYASIAEMPTIIPADGKENA